MPDRRALDDIIFDVLGFTQGERDAVYEEWQAGPAAT